MYMIGQTGMPGACLSTTHQLVTWTEGLGEGTVAESMLADGAVTAPKLGTGAVGGTQLAAGAVDSVHVAAGAIGVAHFGTNAIPARVVAEIAAGATPTIAQGRNVVDVTRVAMGEYDVLLAGEGALQAPEMTWVATTRGTSGSASILPHDSYVNVVKVFTYNSGGAADYNFYIVGY